MHGERDAAVTVVPAGLQREALALLVAAAGPATLELPRDLREALAPRSPGAGPSREIFGRGAEASFDWLAPRRWPSARSSAGSFSPSGSCVCTCNRGEEAEDQLGPAEVMGRWSARACSWTARRPAAALRGDCAASSRGTLEAMAARAPPRRVDAALSPRRSPREQLAVDMPALEAAVRQRSAARGAARRPPGGADDPAWQPDRRRGRPRPAPRRRVLLDAD